MADRQYRALLIGNWHYPEDPANLPDLKGPINDVSRLGEVLADPAVGLFAPADVTTLTERASHEITAELEHFFADAGRSDVLFVYYSGHGLTSDDGSLLLCGRNARTDRKLASTVSAETINRMMRGCAAAAIVIVLDCCHAGAFKSGEFAADLAGKGRFVLAASRSRDRAPDAEHSTGLSRFTGHLLRGLRGGALPAGSDHITLSDLYRYVHRSMTSEGPVIPQRRFDGDGDIALARHVIVAAPAEPTAPGLTVSETLIDVGQVHPGEVLPPERIYITARALDGSATGWSAETEADWVVLRPAAGHLELLLTPKAGATRANVIVRNERTGETRTVRIVARLVVPAEPTAAIPVVPAATGTLYGQAREPQAPLAALPPGDVEVAMPQLGEGITTVELVRWLKRVGDPVRDGEPLVGLSTDKIDAEMPAPASGTLVDIAVEDGATVDVGTRIAVIRPGSPQRAADQGRYDVVLTRLGSPGQHLKLMATLNKIAPGQGFLQRAMVAPPATVLTSVDRPTADRAIGQLRAAGATAELRPTAAPAEAAAPPRPAADVVRATLPRYARRLAIHLLPGSKADRNARKQAAVSPAEQTLGAIELPSGGAALFTTKAFYLADRGVVKALPYRDFPAAEFLAQGKETLTHIDLGDGVLRLVGRTAGALLSLLIDIQDEL